MSEKKVESKKGGKLKLIIIFIIIIAVVVAGVFGGFYYFFTKKYENQVQIEHELKGIVTYNMEEMTTNLKGGDNKMIKCTPALGYDGENKKLEEELAAKDTIIRSKIIEVLNAKEQSEFESDKEVIIKKQIVNSINQILEEGKVTEVYFRDKVIS